MDQRIVIMFARIANDLIADTRHHRHQHNPGQDPFPQGRPAQKRKNKNSDQHDDH